MYAGRLILFCTLQVANQMVTQWSGPPAMLNIFRKFFGSFSAPHIIKQNNFANFQLYFLQKVIPVAMAGKFEFIYLCICLNSQNLFDMQACAHLMAFARQK